MRTGYLSGCCRRRPAARLLGRLRRPHPRPPSPPFLHRRRGRPFAGRRASSRTAPFQIRQLRSARQQYGPVAMAAWLAVLGAGRLPGRGRQGSALAALDHDLEQLLELEDAALEGDAALERRTSLLEDCMAKAAEMDAAFPYHGSAHARVASDFIAMVSALSDAEDLDAEDVEILKAALACHVRRRPAPAPPPRTRATAQHPRRPSRRRSIPASPPSTRPALPPPQPRPFLPHRTSGTRKR